MATKRQKKEEAKRRIQETVPTLPLPKNAPKQLQLLNLILRGAEVGGQALVELDPLGILTDDPAIMPARDLTMAMVNDPSFKMSADMVDLINNDNRMLADMGNGPIEINGRDVIRRSGQFSRMALSPRTIPKRGRKKTKTDKTMSKALAQANKELRKKNGQLRRGVTQADIMRRAHRLRRKMSS